MTRLEIRVKELENELEQANEKIDNLEFENKDLRSKSKIRTSQIESGGVDEKELERRVQLVYKEMEEEIKALKASHKHNLAKKEE